MKCKKCNFEADTKFCPNCGEKMEDENNVSVTKVLCEAYKQHKMTRLKLAFLGAFMVAVIAFCMGLVSAGVLFTVAGVLISPFVLKKLQGKKKYLVIALSIILMIWGAYSWWCTVGNSTIDSVKEYKDPDCDYSIGEYIELPEYEVEWSYSNVEGTEYVIASYTDNEKKVDVIFVVYDCPELYDVLVNDESNADLYNEYNSRLFGIESDEDATEKQASEEERETQETKKEVKETEKVTEKVKETKKVEETKEVQQTTVMEPDLKWYIDYNNFYSEDGKSTMEIWCQNDIMLMIQIKTGIAMNDYTVNAEPCEIGPDGELVYTDDINYCTITYYPDGNYIKFENAEGLMNGIYYY